MLAALAPRTAALATRLPYSWIRYADYCLISLSATTESPWPIVRRGNNENGSRLMKFSVLVPAEVKHVNLLETLPRLTVSNKLVPKRRDTP